MIIISYYHKYWTASNCIIEDDSQWEKLISRNVEKVSNKEENVSSLSYIVYRFYGYTSSHVYSYLSRKKNYAQITILKLVGRICFILR